MANRSQPTRIRALFEAALRDYEKKAGVALASHPLTVQLQSCHSLESITTVLLGQAQTFGEFPRSDRVMESIKSIISILSRLSATPFLGDDIGFVRHKTLMAYPIALTIFYSHSHL
jgi:hypothetical protein